MNKEPLNLLGITVYRGDLGRDLIESVPFRTVVTDLKLDPKDVDALVTFITEMVISEGLVKRGNIYGLDYQTVFRKLQNLTEEK